MTGAPTERWRQIEELLAAALDREPAAREKFLDAACAGDAALRSEVASLLAAHERPGALDRLAPEVASITAELRGTAALLAGRTIGHYQVLEPVGGGGMGVIYKALDTRLGRMVALKFLQPRLDSDRSAAERFRLEARAAGALDHPNICTIHDVGETEDGRLYLAMPLYDGETLEQRIRRGPLAIDEAADIAVQVLRGLAKAHARGIIHRDIKPSNVFITTDGVVKLLDFGIAKLADVSLTGPASRPLGTVAYMSPEQAHGTPVDHRTDLWSLGAVLYEMVSGQRPYPRGVPLATAGRVIAPAFAVVASAGRHACARAGRHEGAREGAGGSVHVSGRVCAGAPSPRHTRPSDDALGDRGHRTRLRSRETRGRRRIRRSHARERALERPGTGRRPLRRHSTRG